MKMGHSVAQLRVQARQFQQRLMEERAVCLGEINRLLACMARLAPLVAPLSPRQSCF